MNLGHMVLLARTFVLGGMNRGNNFRQKEIALAEAISQTTSPGLNQSLAETGHMLEATGDNWLDPVGAPDGASGHPDISASLAITRRDERGNIVATAMTAVYGGNFAVVADGKQAYIYRTDSVQHLIPIREIDSGLIKDMPVRVFHFGQKSAPHWVNANVVQIAALVESGVRAQNDCGPYYGIMGWFQTHTQAGVIHPTNTVYIEPYANKPKEELMAFVIHSLNQGIAEGEPFAVVDMAGDPLFADGALRQEGVDAKYKASGFALGPPAAVERALDILADAVPFSPLFADSSTGDEKSDAKMALLAATLRRRAERTLVR